MSRDYSKEEKLEEARLLMPWYLTGHLSKEDLVFVEQALEEYPELQTELSQEEQIIDLVRDNSKLLELSTLDSTENRFEQLMNRIDREEKAESKEVTLIDVAKTKEPTPAFQWLKELFSFQWLTPANAVFATLLLFQLGFIGVYLQQADRTPAGETIYTSASVSPEGAISATKNPLLMVEFKEDAQHGQVCNFLMRHEAEIIEGPNAYNIFTIQVKGLSDAEAAIKRMNTEVNSPIVFVGKKFTQ